MSRGLGHWASEGCRDTLAGYDLRHRRKNVSEPISTERFAVLVERVGLKLTPEQFEELMAQLRMVAAAVGRTI